MNARKQFNNDEIYQCLREDFKLKQFRPWQKETIDSILAGKDTFAIMPTGSGKSLTYQLPTKLLAPQLTLVVSPLISLMQDQVEKSTGLRAATLHSSQDRETSQKVKQMVKSGQVDILYVSSERLSTTSLTDLLGTREVGLFAVDEAHCISVWGHNFRPSYLFLPDICKRLGNPQVALFTATAPPHTRDDVIKVMKLTNYHLVEGDIVRNNISFDVLFKSDTEKQTTLQEIVHSKVKIPGSIIVYGNTIAEVEGIQRLLSKTEKTALYHGQMEPETKMLNQKMFMQDDARVIACTSAFGMGIDKPDVYTIIHYSLPGSLESYIQESGRAGRDGNPAQAILFFDYDDVKIQNMFIRNANPPPLIVKRVYEKLFETSKKISDYQGKPVSLTQLKWFLEKADQEKWFKNRTISAFGTLANLGFIVRNGDEITFPHGPTIELPEEILEAKHANDYRRLQMMELYAQSPGDHQKIIKSYFLGAKSELVKATEDIKNTIFRTILGFVGNYKASKGKIGEIISGETEAEEDYGKYNRALPFVSSEFISVELEDLVYSGYIRPVKMGVALQYRLTERGAATLNKTGVNIKQKPSIPEDMHDFRNMAEVKKGLEDWVREKSVSLNYLQVLWKGYYEQFLESQIEIDGDYFTGKTLLQYQSGAKTPTDSAFRQLFEHFLGVEFKTETQEKGSRYRRYHMHKKHR